MAKAGQIIENTLTGDRVRFIKTNKDTNGELLRFEEWLKVDGVGPVEHLHPKQTEHFEVISGTMGVLLDGNVHILHPGDTISVPPGRWHRWWNAGADELYHISEFRPAMKFERFMETLFWLGRTGKTFQYGAIPYGLQFAVLSDAYKDTVYLRPLPIIVQKVLYASIAPIGKMLGYKPYPQKEKVATVEPIAIPEMSEKS